MQHPGLRSLRHLRPLPPWLGAVACHPAQRAIRDFCRIPVQRQGGVGAQHGHPARLHARAGSQCRRIGRDRLQQGCRLRCWHCQNQGAVFRSDLPVFGTVHSPAGRFVLQLLNRGLQVQPCAMPLLCKPLDKKRCGRGHARHAHPAVGACLCGHHVCALKAHCARTPGGDNAVLLPLAHLLHELRVLGRKRWSAVIALPRTLRILRAPRAHAPGWASAFLEDIHAAASLGQQLCTCQTCHSRADHRDGGRAVHKASWLCASWWRSWLTQISALVSTPSSPALATMDCSVCGGSFGSLASIQQYCVSGPRTSAQR